MRRIGKGGPNGVLSAFTLALPLTILIITHVTDYGSEDIRSNIPVQRVEKFIPAGNPGRAGSIPRRQPSDGIQPDATKMRRVAAIVTL